MAYDVNKIRKDFPILQREIRPGIQLIYLDSDGHGPESQRS